MNAYEMSEYKIKLLRELHYLEREYKQNDTGTVSLTNAEVAEIVEMFLVCIATIDEELKKR